jgi:hypothetical protein
MTLPFLSDEEIDGICDGLVQSAAKVRFLKGLGLPVERKPNGRPLVRRCDWDRMAGVAPAQPEGPGPNWSVKC